MKLSIVIPCYNSEKYLGECLKSVFSQSYKDFEVIVVDAYSKDRTQRVIREYAERYPRRFHLAYRRPQGEPDAINAGMEIAVGDIVAYIDSDDTYEQGCFESVIEAFERNPQILWLYGRGKVINEKGHESRGIVTAIKECFWPMYKYESFQCFNYIVQPTVFMRKSFYDRVGQFDTGLKYVFDYDYWLRAGIYSAPMFLNVHLANWRAHGESVTGLAPKAEARQALKVQAKYSSWYYRPLQYVLYLLTIGLYWSMNHK